MKPVQEAKKKFIENPKGPEPCTPFKYLYSLAIFKKPIHSFHKKSQSVISYL